MILKIIIGLIVGFIFGYTLQRTGITKYPRVMGLLLLKDFKILKFMLTAVTFSMIGFYILDSIGIITLNPKPLDLGKLVGGLLFGVGMGLLGYCPGTMLSRIGERGYSCGFGDSSVDHRSRCCHPVYLHHLFCP